MFSMVVKDLRLAPTRNFLTGLSMFVGIVALILSVLIGSLGKSYLHATNEQIYGYSPHVAIRFSNAQRINPDSLDTLKTKIHTISKNSAVPLTPEEEFSFSTLDENIPHPYNYRGIQTLAGSYDAKYVSQDYKRVYNLPMSHGRWFRDDVSSEMVVNKAAARKIHINKIAYLTNKTWQNAISVTVVGIVNDGVDDTRVYVNCFSLLAFAPQQFSSTSGTIDLHNIRGLPQSALRSSLSDMLTDTVGGEITEISNDTQPSDYEDVAHFLEMGFAISAVVLLAVSALGLINIGLATIEQRSRELLIRRALGATRTSVAMLVLGGSLLIAIIVSAIAVLTTYLCVKSVPVFLPADTPIPTPPTPTRPQ